MNESSQLFSQKLDRAAFSAYFLGAIVPLVAFAWVVERYALPQLGDRGDALGLIALVFSTALLSLGSFLVLRNRARRSLAQMDGDNRRLASLLGAATSLASTEHLSEAMEQSVGAALELADATSAYLFVDDAEPGECSLAAAAGDEDGKHIAALENDLLPMVRMVLDDGRPALRDAANHGDFSAIVVPLPGESRPLGALVAIARGTGAETSAKRIDALSTLAALASVALRNGDLRDAQRNFFSHVTDILVSALDVHLGFHEGHGRRVAALANRMGRTLGFDDAAMHRLHFAGLLHDIGMLKLDRTQQMTRRTCDRHATIGARMLGRIRLWEDIAPAVEHHHEWFDGSGYPAGLSGEDIPVEARILCICDAYDTMTSPDSYREAKMPSDAMEELERCAGSQFDPELVACFRASMEGAPLPSAPPPAED